MSDKFQNKYRIPSARLQNWDYGWNAAYFITICTQNRECYFGEIVDDQMILSEIGTIVQQYWNAIPTHFPFVELGEFIVMPNHLHGIIIIDKPDDGRHNETPPSVVETPKLGVSTIPAIEPIPTTEPISTNRTAAASEKWNPGTLGVILNQYKRICTIDARKIHADYGWQSRFHDHIIRNDESFQRISEYIRNNPLNWRNDKFFNETQPVKTPNLGVSTIPATEPVHTNEIIPAIPTTEPISTNRTAAASEKWNPGTLGVILNQYKRICTIHARKIHADYGWQSRFHDHIIRNDESFQRISEYIRNNSLNWRNDKFFNET